MASAAAVQTVSDDSVLTNAPPVNAVLEQSTLASLRGVQHKDVDGNPISAYYPIASAVSSTDCHTSRSRLVEPYSSTYGATARHHSFV
jgi:hypothetical protein